MRIPVLSLVCLLASPVVPALDLVGGAAWDELRLELAVNGRTGVVLDQGDREIDLIELGGGVGSYSGYRFNSQPRSGWLIGAKAKASSWFDQDETTDFTAVGGSVSAVGGLWFQLGGKVRLELAPELGLGVAIAKYRGTPREDSRSVDSQPYLHYGMHVRALYQHSEGRSIGLDFGYDADRLPYVESQGVTVGLIIGF